MTAQHNIVEQSIAQHSTLRYNIALYSTVKFRTPLCDITVICYLIQQIGKRALYFIVLND